MTAFLIAVGFLIYILIKAALEGISDYMPHSIGPMEPEEWDELTGKLINAQTQREKNSILNSYAAKQATGNNKKD